ncbi:hypothetical protein C8A01DRAFT_33465 [Parachaetomium inaequale]|uniref:Uncharacterized protein n=1 Tax=Parachaetomium inaequale TaxID=2588326 RepID=A0AAN6PKT1_9PEZI|nr:hypothetical protein C8A01DRAFT_33465 [Parachaetomium inaequale]
MPHFEAWYPQFGSRLNAIMLANCSEQLQYYRMSDPPYSCRGCKAASVQTCLPDSAPGWMKANMAIGVGCLAEAVETCILANAPEWMKSNMGAAGVLLGLLPTILSLAGPDTAETGLLAQRRPFLASLIALGSPAVSPYRMFMASDPAELLLSDKKSGTGSLMDIQNLGFMQKLGILAAQYLLAAAAVVGVFHNSWTLGVQTLCSFSTESTYHPLLWAATALLANTVSAIATLLRIAITEHQHEHGHRPGPPVVLSSSPPPVTYYTLLPAKLQRMLQREFQLSGAPSHTTTSIIITRKPNSYPAAIAAWLTSTGTILHIIYGTITFSTVVFISTQDALGVVARYLVSTLVCRIILNFELSGMRAVVRGDGEGEGDGQGTAVVVGARPGQMLKAQTAP